MKKVFINNDNLKEEEIDEEVIRAKGLIIKDNKILLGYSHNTYQFPGGHMEKGENKEECLIREIKEETGMDITLDELKPLMMIKYYSKNYLNKGKNRCNKLYYFIVQTEAEINLEETNYTEEEINGNYELRYINLDDVEDVLIDNSNKYPKYKGITYEMLEVLFEYRNNYEC